MDLDTLKAMLQKAITDVITEEALVEMDKGEFLSAWKSWQHHKTTLATTSDFVVRFCGLVLISASLIVDAATEQFAIWN